MGRNSTRSSKDPNFDGPSIEARPADLGLCVHEIADDQDCIECRTNRCPGGGACDCPTERSKDLGLLVSKAHISA